MHWATALAGATQGAQALPQVATSKFDTQSPPHWWKPVAQVEPQSVPSQVGVPLGGTVQAVHRVPQEFTSKFDTHWLPHLWNPAAQLNSHTPAVQAGMELGPALQLRHWAPQAVGVFEGTQLPPQRLVLAGHPQRAFGTSHTWPPPQSALDWHPKTHFDCAVSQ